MGKYNKLANQIIELIGGEDNVRSLNHCVTRLRFRLKDESIANDEAIKNIDGVITVMKSAGQYQVVIGNHVPKVYEEILEVTSIGGSAAKAADEDSKDDSGIFARLLDVLSGSFQPFLGVLAASGMIKGIVTLLVSFKLMEMGSDTYNLLFNVGDAVFYFMPIMLAYTASKKFKLNQITGLAIGMGMMMPALQKTALAAGEGTMIFANTFMAGEAFTKVFGFIPIIAYDYASSVVPILFIIAFAAQVQKLLKKSFQKLYKTS